MAGQGVGIVPVRPEGVGAGAAGVFPFGLGGEPVEPALAGGEPRAKREGVVVGDLGHRFVVGGAVVGFGVLPVGGEVFVEFALNVVGAAASVVDAFRDVAGGFDKRAKAVNGDSVVREEKRTGEGDPVAGHLDGVFGADGVGGLPTGPPGEGEFGLFGGGTHVKGSGGQEGVGLAEGIGVGG